MPTTTSLLAFVAQGLRVAASFNSPDIWLWTRLIENSRLPGTTLDENGPTLFENRPIISVPDHINEELANQS